jgi:hypothetical protein
MPAYFFKIALRRIPITPGVNEKLVVSHADAPYSPGDFLSGALLGGNRIEGGPALFNFVAAAVRALDVPLPLMVSDRQEF